MRVIETGIEGCYVIELQPHADERGHLARTYCSETFARLGMAPIVAQCTTSFSHARGTLRGMHWQAAPHSEAKLVRCTRGRIYDVALDLREHSSTFLKWHAIELTPDNLRTHYIGDGMAHGFQTLEDASEVFYQMSVPYRPELARGVRWNDAAFDIGWPLTPTCMSKRDATFPDFRAARREACAT
jgi:dTDP-4-dehydrorhamnose 3,5-epimerase